jgi:hypothetical protein
MELGGSPKGLLVRVQSRGPNLHTAVGGLHPEMRGYLQEYYGTATRGAAKGLFLTEGFSTQRLLLEQFYESLGMRMPRMTSPGLP